MGSATGEMKPVWRQEARAQTVLNNLRPSVGAAHVKYQQRVTKGALLVTLKCPERERRKVQNKWNISGKRPNLTSRIVTGSGVAVIGAWPTNGVQCIVGRMGHLRRTLLWLCSAALVFSGVLGRGFVLCLPADGAARLEVSGDDGRCLDVEGIRSEAGGSEGSLTSDSLHCHGCEDVTISDGAAQRPATGADYLVAPPLLFVTMPPRLAPTVAFTSRLSRDRNSLMHPRSSDVHTVRKTVILLV
ncbi:MAG: hypothetical protein C0501_18820 [Isosphaera sp.]|nr:hypothetical protein [Isosphaera sp.]